MSDISANLALPYLAASQAQKHVTHNEALQILDAVVQLSVADRDRTAPPAAPETGARHIVAAGATGAWAGQDGQVALWTGSAWSFLDPQPGWRAWIGAEESELVWYDSAWQAPPLSGLDNASGVGVNTSADAVNRLAVSAAATLLSHEGAGHQLKINKAAVGDTASLLFQSGWSGRAEMGLAGSDGWAIKVSADGSAWTEALTLDPATGHATGAAVQSGATDATPGRLMAVGAFGLGATGQSLNFGDDLNTVSGTQFIGNLSGSSMPDNAPADNRARVGFHAEILDQRAAQLLIDTQSGSERPNVHVRARDTDWTAWTRLYGEHNIVGPVFMSGNLPGGAVLERGSNANGTYVRFADGTQICMHSFAGTEVTSATGPVYSSNSTNWTFPAGFAPGTIPTVNVGIAGSASRWARGRGVDAVTGQVKQFSPTSSTTLLDYQVAAFGRWF